MSSFRLDGRLVAVAGGLGRVGRGVVRSLHEAGAALLVLDQAEGGERILETLAPGGERCSLERFDVSDTNDLPGRIEALEQRHGPMAAWVNCAYPRTADWGLPLDRTGPEHWLRNLEMQLASACLCAEAVAGRMASRGAGAIVNVGSIYGVQAPDFRIYEGTGKTTPSIYAAAKGGLIAHARWLASYFAESGVRVNVVCPGGLQNNQTEPFLSRFNAKTLLGRMATAREIGDPVVFLVSDASSYITGQALLVDGGMSCF